jgi:hypothetical protein
VIISASHFGAVSPRFRLREVLRTVGDTQRLHSEAAFTILRGIDQARSTVSRAIYQ